MKALFKNRNAMILWISRSLSRFGDSMEELALMYVVLDLTGSALSMGAVMIFSMIPNVVISPIAGVLVDRYNKKFIMFVSEIIRALCLLLIPLLVVTGYAKLWHIYAISTIISIAESFFEPCSGVVFTLVVTNDELPLLNSLSTTTNSIMKTLGKAVSAIFLAISLKELLFIIDAITFLISAIAAIIITIPKTKPKKIEHISEFATDIIDGFKYVFKDNSLPTLFLTILLVSALTTPINQFTALFTKDTLLLKDEWAGYFLTVLTIGTVFGGILYPILFKLKMKIHQMYILSLGLMGISIILVCYFPSKYLSMIMFFIVGVGMSLIGMWSFTKVQQSCDKNYLGRVGSVASIAMLAASPLASAVSGWAIDLSSVQTIFKAIGICFLIIAPIIYVLASKHIKENENITVSESISG